MKKNWLIMFIKEIQLYKSFMKMSQNTVHFLLNILKHFYISLVKGIFIIKLAY